MHAGDDLEDDYFPDPDLVVASEEDEAHGSEDDDYEEFHGLKDSEVSPGVEEDKSISKKRKRRDKEKEKKAKASNQKKECTGLLADSRFRNGNLWLGRKLWRLRL
jgi:hypothetical protein